MNDYLSAKGVNIMNEESSTYVNGISDDGSPLTDEYLPGPIQVLLHWIILLISTIATFFSKKSEG